MVSLGRRVFLPELAFRKGIDRSGRNRCWSRFLPEHTVSTTGLLTWLVQSAVKTQERHAGFFSNGLKFFLKHCLQENSFELPLPLEKDWCNAYASPGLLPPEYLCRPIPCDARVVPLQAFLSGPWSPEKEMLTQLFSRLSSSGLVQDGFVQLNILL